MDKTDMIKRLTERMREVTPLPDEEDFTTSEETITRYLKAFEWKYADAEAGLLHTLEYRRETQPLRKCCTYCHKQAGFHSMRQVGHDESGRPVVYANFAQASAKKTTSEDVVDHVTYLIENAKATMGKGVSTWVFIVDCTGMTLSMCRPKVGHRAVSMLSSHYPERLGLVICVNHSPIFHAFWKAIKGFMAPGTVSKMRLVRSEAKIKQTFSTFFSDDLSEWLWDEITLNKAKTLPETQRKFWEAPANAADHDPRGSPSYVKNCIDKFDPSQAEFVPGRKKYHCPHPNIVRAPENDSVEVNGDTCSGGCLDDRVSNNDDQSDDESLGGDLDNHSGDIANESSDSEQDRDSGEVPEADLSTPTGNDPKDEQPKSNGLLTNGTDR